MSNREISREYKENAIDGRVVPADITPLDYMLTVMRDPKEPNWRRDLMARLAAPYCHERRVCDRPSKKVDKAKAARKAGKDTEWAGLLKTGILAAQIGKKGSSQAAR